VPLSHFLGGTPQCGTNSRMLVALPAMWTRATTSQPALLRAGSTTWPVACGGLREGNGRVCWFARSPA
jgi:hypothetical protein